MAVFLKLRFSRNLRFWLQANGIKRNAPCALSPRPNNNLRNSILMVDNLSLRLTTKDAHRQDCVFGLHQEPTAWFVNVFTDIVQAIMFRARMAAL